MTSPEEALKISLYIVIYNAIMTNELPSSAMELESDSKLHTTAIMVEILAECAGYIEMEKDNHFIATAKGKQFMKDHAYLVLAALHEEELVNER